MLKRLLHHPTGQALLAALLTCYLRFALASTRWTLVGAEYVAPFTVPGAPAVVAFWHERLPLMPALWLLARRRPEGRALRGRILASRHGDGRLLGQLMQGFGVEVAHGSSSRGGAAGLRARLDALEGGAHAIITPDGPRGPPRRAALGVASLAALSGAPILPCAAQSSARHVLRSWDSMVLPLPFGRGRIVCLAPIHVPRDGAAASLSAIEAALTRAAAIADGAATL